MPAYLNQTKRPRRIHEVDAKVGNALIELIDLIIPSDERASGNFNNIFFVLEYAQADLKYVL